MGNYGSSKTYFCAALTEWLFRSFKSFRYHKEGQLLQRLRYDISEGFGDWSKSLELLIDDDLVILDDLGSEINEKGKNIDKTGWYTKVIHEFVDNRYNSQKPTIITTNLTRIDFEDIFPGRTIDRLFAVENIIIEDWESISKRKLGL